MLTLNRKTIGIFGGSFDPPHKGHVEISKISLKKIRLKKVYWIITKKNPFKKKPFFSLKERISKSKKTMSNKQVKKFIMFYERITRHMLKTSSFISNVLINIDTKHCLKSIKFN